jgi:homoserine kinase
VTDLAAGPVTVRSPATSANLGPGFDCLGLCLDLADVVTAEVITAGTEIVVTGEGAAELPEDDSHLVVATIRGAFDAWRVRQPGLRLTCANAIPQGRGLGSSAAAIVAGLRLAEALLPDHSVDDQEMLSFAAALDGHADNVAACLLGGLVVAWTDSGGPSAVRLDVDPRIVPVMFCADRPMSTSLARGLLPEVVSHADAAANSARAALLVVALTSRPDLLLPATRDWMHQEARRSTVPDSMRLVDRLRERLLPAVISGAGPSVLSLCTAEQVDRLADETPPGWQLLRLKVDLRGARLVTS